MKKQISRFSPHQNAKVFAALMTVGSLPMFLPMMAISFFTAPQLDTNGNPVEFPFLLLALMPIIYMIFSYFSIIFGCWIYNLLFRFVGGFEVETIITDYKDK